MPRRIVVIGHGTVGARLVDVVRRRDPGGRRVRLTVFGSEQHHACNRVLLSTVLAGGLTADAVRLTKPGRHDRNGVLLRTGVEVAAIDRTQRHVVRADGRREPYDELVVATGSRAWVPPIDGLLAESGGLAAGTTTFRDLDDRARILRLARPGSQVAVLGGGLLGLEATRGLLGRGVRVCCVPHPQPHLMERQLDAGAGAVLAAMLRRLGAQVRPGVLATRCSPDVGLECDDGSLHAIDAVVVAAGVRPDAGLAAAGLAVDGGVLVDARAGIGCGGCQQGVAGICECLNRAEPADAEGGAA